MEVLHLDFDSGTVRWIGPLMSQLRDSPIAELRARYQRWAECGLGELALAIATRLAIAFRVGVRFSELLNTLRDEIADSGKIDQLLLQDAAFRPADEHLLFDICAAFDACIFELRSFYELIGKFTTLYCREMLGKIICEQDILMVLGRADVSAEWVAPLRDNRKLFFHQTAPWIALEVKSRVPFECSLIAMKQNLSEFTDSEKYVSQEQVMSALSGLQDALRAIRSWLSEEVNRFEDNS